MRSHAMIALSIGAIWFGVSGCRTLDRFDTKDGDAYCGSIVNAGFVRDGFTPKPSELRMRVQIDTDNLQTAPGTLTTNDDDPNDPNPPDDAVIGLCAPNPLFS